MKPSGNMLELDKNLFTGSMDIDSEEAGRAEVRNLGNVINRKLSSFSWNGIKDVRCIGLALKGREGDTDREGAA